MTRQGLWIAERRAEWRGQGRCLDCGKPAGGRARCEKHLAEIRESVKRSYWKGAGKVTKLFRAVREGKMRETANVSD